MKSLVIPPAMAYGASLALTTLAQKRNEIRKTIKDNKEAELRVLLYPFLKTNSLTQCSTEQLIESAYIIMKELELLEKLAKARYEQTLNPEYVNTILNGVDKKGKQAVDLRRTRHILKERQQNGGSGDAKK